MNALHNHTAGKIDGRYLAAAAIVVGLALGVSGTAAGKDSSALGTGSASFPAAASHKPPTQALLGEGDCVSATSSAWPSTDAGFEGYWKYCVTISWDVGRYGQRARGPSDISILLGLDNCLRACSPGYFAMEDTVGVSALGESCTVYYRSEFATATFPGIPQPALTLKFKPYENRCGQCLCGTARVCFYSLAPPKPAYSFPSSVLVRFGRYMGLGRLEGPIPTCIDPANAVEPTTWGRIKALID